MRQWIEGIDWEPIIDAGRDLLRVVVVYAAAFSGFGSVLNACTGG